MCDRGTQTYTQTRDTQVDTGCQSNSSLRPAAPPTAPMTAKCTQTSDVALFHRSVYSDRTAPQPCSEPSERDSPVVGADQPEPCSNRTFDDSEALTAAVRQCRQHVEDISTEATCVEQQLNKLATCSPQRQQILDAVEKLDNLRQHINATQQLIGNIDIMIRQGAPSSHAQQPCTSRSELVQRELGRLSSRLCCTVLGLERAMNKAICRATESGGMTMTHSAADTVDHRCVHQIETSTSEQQLPAGKSQSTPQSPHPTTVNICQQWLQQQADQQRPCPSPTVPPVQPEDHHEPVDEESPQHREQNDVDVSLEDIHRKLGSIISDIDHPAEQDQQQDQVELAEPEAVQEQMSVSGVESQMTDSRLASSTDVLAELQLEQTSAISGRDMVT